MVFVFCKTFDGGFELFVWVLTVRLVISGETLADFGFDSEPLWPR